MNLMAIHLYVCIWKLLCGFSELLSIFIYNITLRKDKYIQICLQSMYSFKPSRLYFHGFSSKYELFHVMKCPVYIYSMTKLCLVRFYFNFDFYDENSEHFTAAKMRLCKVLVKSNVDRKHLYY